MDRKIQPALIGGVAFGVLSSIPFVNLPNCCCIWAIVGGALAAYMYISKSEVPAMPADGAILGAIAGVIGAAIYMIIGVPIGYVTGNVAMRMLYSLGGINLPGMADAFSIGRALLNGLLVSVCFVIFSTIGGLLGTVIFEKRKGGTGGMTPPPPSSNFGGTPPPPQSGFGGNQPGGFGGGNQPGGGFNQPGGGSGSNQPGGFGGGQPGGSGGGGGMGGNQPGGFGR